MRRLLQFRPLVAAEDKPEVNTEAANPRELGTTAPNT
jgi:hypothetical protein